MTPANLSAIALLVLIVWRLVFNFLRRRPLVREIAALQHNTFLRRGRNILEQVGTALIAYSQYHAVPGNSTQLRIFGNPLENGSEGVDPFDRKDRARTYLRRIVALTGAKQMGNRFVLDIGATRFHVRDRYVSRLRDVSDPKCEYERTCFCLAYKNIPKAEQIASALLQLRSNPALFDRWAAQIGAFKADGQGFSRAQ